MIEERRVHAPHWIKHLVGGGVTVFCLFVFVRQVNLFDVFNALVHFRWPYLFAGIASLSVGYAFRIIRWSVMLRAAGASLTFADCGGPFLGSIALNNVLPLRVGDVVRALVFPKAMGITKTIAASSLVIERLVDLMTLLVCLAIGLFALQTITIPVALKASAMSLATIGGVVLVMGFLFSGSLSRFFSQRAAQKSSALERAYGTVGGLLHGFDVMLRPRVLLLMLVISMCVWAAEAGLFYFIMHGAAVDGSPLIALFVMTVATLSTLVPSSPGYVGSFHLAAYTAILLVGGTAAQAGSYAVIVHLALWFPTTLAGAFAIWVRPELFRSAKAQAAES